METLLEGEENSIATSRDGMREGQIGTGIPVSVGVGCRWLWARVEACVFPEKVAVGTVL